MRGRLIDERSTGAPVGGARGPRHGRARLRSRVHLQPVVLLLFILWLASSSHLSRRANDPAVPRGGSACRFVDAPRPAAGGAARSIGGPQRESSDPDGPAHPGAPAACAGVAPDRHTSMRTSLHTQP